jgi:2-phospho-L-lactate/phosphoenolpyruvate guanylyltransferase
MSLCLLLPIKPLVHGKSRLGEGLPDAARRELLERFVHHTLGVASAFPGTANTLVISSCSDATALARAYGIATVREPAVAGLNAALRLGRAAAREQGATRILVLPCDLAFLSVEDVRCLAAAAVSAKTIGIAPDRRYLGTNALSLPAPIEFEFAFGPNSFEIHKQHARALGFEVETVDRAGLAFDVDTLKDYAEFSAGLNSPTEP